MIQNALNVLLELKDEDLEDVLACNTCNQIKTVSNFYIESSSKRTRVYQRRKQCIDCWAELKGKTIKSYPSNSVLFYCEAI
jgi:hypothetical protein